MDSEVSKGQDPGTGPSAAAPASCTPIPSPAAGTGEAGERGLPIGLSFERRKSGGPPRLEARLSRLRYPRFGKPFAPLRLPEQTHLVLHDLDLQVVQQGMAQLKLELVPGRHELPFTRGEPFVVEVSPGTVVQARVQLASLPADGAGQPAALPATVPPPSPSPLPGSAAAPAPQVTVLHDGELRFEPPLVLPNVLNTMVEVQHLFEDRRVAELLHKASALPGMQTARAVGSVALDLGGRAAGFLRRRLDERFGARLQALVGADLGELEQRLEETLAEVTSGENATVLLSRVRARRRWEPRRRQWELELAFSGHLRWFERLSNPFQDVVLPAAVLPVLHASLDRLCSREPLASGGFFAQRLAVLPLLRALLASFSAAHGRFALELQPPVLCGSGTAVDRTRFAAEAHLPSPLVVRGEVEATREGEQSAAVPDGDTSTCDGEAAVPVPAPPPAHATLHIAFPRLSVTFAGQQQQEQAIEARARARAALDLGDAERSWPRRVRAELGLELLPGSSLPQLDFALRSAHPWVVGSTCYRLVLEKLRPAGAIELSWADRRLALRPADRGLSCTCRFSLPEQLFMERGETRSSGSMHDGELSLELLPLAEGTWQATLHARAALHHGLLTRVTPIAELNIEDSLLRARLDCALELGGKVIARFHGPVLPELTFCPGGSLHLTVERAEAELDGRLLELPRGTQLTGTMHQGKLASTGPGSFALDVAWDLHGLPCLLHGKDRRRSASLLTRELRQGELTLHVSPGGRFSFSGSREGLYGVRFFNSLLKPASDPGHLLRILGSDDALSHVVAALEVFNPELADLLSSLRELILGAREILRREGIRQPKDIIPRARIARLLSLMLTGTDELVDRLTPIIQSVTEGRGIDLPTTKELLRGPLADFRIDYELDGLLRWFDLVTRPSEPFPRPVPKDAPPFAENPALAGERAGLPSAAEIYAGLQQVPPPPGLVARVAELAPYLTLEQIRYVLALGRPSWGEEHIARLSYVHDLKQRIAEISEGYGGIEYAGMDANLASFLGEAIGPLPGLDDGPEAGEGGAGGPEGWPPPCALGPEEVAVLLQVGLATSRQGLQAQIHNRMLIELIRSRPGSFLYEVLIEMAQHSHRALTGVLFAFLHQDQHQLEHPLDLSSLVATKLGLPVPRQEDYLAGGRKARESYYHALSQLAEQVFDRAGPYLARRAWLREVRHPVEPLPELVGPLAGAEEEARRAIAEADELGRAWGSGDGGWARDRRRRRGGRSAKVAARTQASEAYFRAFSCCAELLRRCPTAFQLPWLREFWARNEEALRVLSVVRNHQEDVDQVRRWLARTSGRPELGEPVADEQELLEAVVRTLYYFPADQEALLADPLVRLLLDPPPGRYDFTIVTAMGVITDGEQGHELEDAFARLEQQRGVRVVRAHTGLFRWLEYNAAMILQAVRKVDGPWGYIGYSQGCANGLLAESILRSGTPEQQRTLERFVGRNLLFSAANGSVHGTSGSRKFVRAMIEGERFLKYYQASYSREAVDLVLRGLKTALDSGVFLDALSGTYSLTLARASWLHRDGQFAPWAPTSITRGIVRPEHLPEALEYLYHVHLLLSPGVGCDSQVAAEEAMGHATRVRNRQTEAFARCDLGGRVQATHHWSPLTVEIEQVTTERDLERAVYQSPKDRHVFPWVEALARFGKIRTMA